MRKFLHRREGAVQTDAIQSFIGGIPRLPAGTPSPTCRACGADLSFFFQYAFSAPHPWQGHTLAVFACTSTADRGDADTHLIPEMLGDEVDLKGADVPRTFLERYQLAFRTLVFETARGVPLAGYVERVAFSPLELRREKHGAIGFLFGTPTWSQDDETPATVAGSRAVFLLQLLGEFPLTPADPIAFPTVPGAPRQKSASYARGWYSLFVGNRVYFFGARKPDPAVYVWTQKD